MTTQTVTETPYEFAPDATFDPDISDQESEPAPDLADTNEEQPPEETYKEPAEDSAAQDSKTQDTLRSMKSRLKDQQKELDAYRRLFSELRSDAEQRLRQADEEAFLNEVRQSYEKDPIAAIRMMLDKNQYEMWSALRDELKSELKAEADLRAAMRKVFEDPQNAILKPCNEEAEYLVSQHGFEPKEAVTFLRNLAHKLAADFRNRASAANRVRTRSAVESGGEPSKTADPDREFYRIIKKAKTLDDMFEGLRKAKVRSINR